MINEAKILHSLVVDLQLPLEHVETAFETDLQNVSFETVFSFLFRLKVHNFQFFQQQTTFYLSPSPRDWRQTRPESASPTRASTWRR